MTVMEEPREAQAYRRETEVEGWKVRPCPSGGAFWEHDGTGEKVREEPECMMRQRHLYYDERLRPVGPPIITEEDKEKGRGTVEGFVSALSDDEVKWWLGELSRLKSE